MSRLTRFRLGRVAHSHIAPMKWQINILGQNHAPGDFQSVVVYFEFNIDVILALPSEVKISLYRIFQEILNNIVKHSGATYAKIRVKILDHTLLLNVRDNGEGFDLQSIAPNSLGLGIMHERADIIGATLNIKSNLGEGTEITVTWPYEERGTSSE